MPQIAGLMTEDAIVTVNIGTRISNIWPEATKTHK